MVYIYEMKSSVLDIIESGKGIDEYELPLQIISCLIFTLDKGSNVTFISICLSILAELIFYVF